MADNIHLSVVTPAREVATVDVDEVTAPGWEGEFGILPNHAPMMALIKSGELMYRQGVERHFIAIGFGFVEVLPDKITVLIETAETEEEIDLERAEAARRRALERLSGKLGEVDYERARAALIRAMSRVKVARRRSRLAEQRGQQHRSQEF